MIKAKNAYAYGPGTIPYEIEGLTQHAALGQTPTFTTNASGWVDVKFGMNADLAPSDPKFNGIEVYDRDPFGFVGAQRNKTGTSAWTVPNMFSGCDAADAGDTGGTASSGFTGNTISGCGGALYPFRTDGYSDGSLSFHGVRTYDSDTQQWSTADAFGGYATNPITGLGYNYAGNNPAVFMDPSGFMFIPCNGICQARKTPFTGFDIQNMMEMDFATDPFLPADWEYFRHILRVTPHCDDQNLPLDVKDPKGGYDKEHLTGGQNVLNPVAAWNNLIGKGQFNYNQYAQPPYRGTANYGIGIYGGAARIPENAALIASAGVGILHHNSLGTITKDLSWTAQGYVFEAKYCK